MELRKATLADVPNLWSLIQSAFADAQSRYIATGQPGYEAYLEDLIDSDDPTPKKLFVMTVEGVFAGFIDVTLSSTNSNFLTRIGIEKEFQGRGLAKQMIHAVSKLNSNRRWELDVSAENSAAIRLYKSLGFDIISTKVWWGRLLPVGGYAESAKKIPNISPNEYYKRYGFTTISSKQGELKIVGTAAGCNDVSQFLDDDQLSKIQSRFPKIDRAFLIIEKNKFPFEQRKDVFEITQVHRMAGWL